MRVCLMEDKWGFLSNPLVWDFLACLLAFMLLPFGDQITNFEKLRENKIKKGGF